MEFMLPYPPSLNHYYRRVGLRTLISRSGREYRSIIRELLAQGAGNGCKPPIDGRIALAMDAFPPDRRRRDLDNLLKCTQDSLAHAGLFEDDSQIDVLSLRRRAPVPGGQIVIRIEALPVRRCLLCGHPLASDESEHPHDN